MQDRIIASAAVATLSTQRSKMLAQLNTAQPQYGDKKK